MWSTCFQPTMFSAYHGCIWGCPRRRLRHLDTRQPALSTLPLGVGRRPQPQRARVHGGDPQNSNTMLLLGLGLHKRAGSHRCRHGTEHTPQRLGSLGSGRGRCSEPFWGQASPSGDAPTDFLSQCFGSAGATFSASQAREPTSCPSARRVQPASCGPQRQRLRLRTGCVRVLHLISPGSLALRGVREGKVLLQALRPGSCRLKGAGPFLAGPPEATRRLTLPPVRPAFRLLGCGHVGLTNALQSPLRLSRFSVCSGVLFSSRVPFQSLGRSVPILFMSEAAASSRRPLHWTLSRFLDRLAQQEVSGSFRWVCARMLCGNSALWLPAASDRACQRDMWQKLGGKLVLFFGWLFRKSTQNQSFHVTRCSRVMSWPSQGRSVCREHVGT